MPMIICECGRISIGRSEIVPVKQKLNFDIVNAKEADATCPIRQNTAVAIEGKLQQI